MTSHLSTRAVVSVGLLAITLPVVSRLAASPLLLLVLSPIIFLFFTITFVVLTLLLGHHLDAKRQRQHPHVYQAARPFAFSTPAAWQAVLTRSQWSQNTTQPLPPLYPQSPEISAALNDILNKIIRDFVWAWYREISSSPSFPTTVSSLLHASLAQLLHRASSLDLAALIVRRILPKVTIHIDQFRQSEMALRGAGLERRLTQSEELDLLLASRYVGRGSAKLHPAIDNLSTTFTKQNEEMHLRQLIDRVLPYILPDTESESKALKIAAREIIACTVLYPVMDMVTDPDFWNRMIDQVAGAAIHQQKLITKVRNILEAQSPKSIDRHPSSQVPAPPTAETITIRTDIRKFESFLRSINRCSSLLDARRLKNDIVGEIRRTRMLLANHEKDDWINGEKTEDVVAFLDRLYTAKRKVEERIVLLGGGDDSKQPTLQDTNSKPRVSLRDVLRNPSSLSYFMEFMDRRHRSLPVQFWLTVESFKDPLENVGSDSSGSEDDLQDLSISPTLKEDISMIFDLYFSAPTIAPTLSSISKKHVDIVRDFVRNGADPSQAAQRRVRRSVLLAQRQIEKDMEQDFEEFERSDLWFRVLSDTHFAAVDTRNVTNRAATVSPPSPISPKSDHPTSPQNIFDGPGSGFGSALSMQRAGSSGSGRSLNRTPTNNIEVLMSPIPDAGTEAIRAPLFNDPEDEMQRAEEKRMEAIHAALTDIMALENEQLGPSLFRDESPDIDKSLKTASSLDKGKRRAVFDDVEAEEADEGGLENSITEESHPYRPAGPGDLQLTYEIARLSDKISHLESQETMLDNLIRKAELTGDTQELKLLNKSKSSMNRELRELQFQKTQYEQQETANRLVSDRTKVSIVSSTVSEEDSKSVVRYLVEVQQLAPDGSFASGWVVARRYNEFFNMHNRLREKYVLVKSLDFPGKRLVTTLSGSFVDMRRVALEKYLQSLIAISIVCESNELRTFLSRDSPFVAGSLDPSSKPFSSTDLVKNVYKHVTESIDDMFFGPSMLDVMIQRLTRQAAELAGIVGSGSNDEDLVAQALNASGKSATEATLMKISGDLKLLEGEAMTFTAPICDLILAVFELNKKNNWLRRQATLIILQQVLGGTIERKIRDTVKGLVEESKIMNYLDMFRDNLWPGGKLKSPEPPRTAEDRMRTRDEANRKLSSLVPDLAANMIGRTNARRGARRIFAVLQNRRLNQHIAYTIVDEVRTLHNSSKPAADILL
ncbi:PhoX domain-containing protein [Macrolepiota fuliginosa MF-IS2]|uniref:PhoX domain-containing protein n=1 Tax=Macrolepiota fuliginosa MF-IS2 TaxID=1400762 RepID=A0A9P6C6Y7_9AGAR|nr:PhoX domain-containing protein [Macrolepiota fuliginosa MF-IS2]